MKNEKEQNGMNDAQLDVLLVQIAKLVQATAKDAEDAARIIREAKTTAQK